jgi:hypothetical protein
MSLVGANYAPLVGANSASLRTPYTLRVPGIPRTALLLLLFHAKLCFAWVVRARLRGQLLGRGFAGVVRAGLREQLLGRGCAGSCLGGASHCI